ncbi:lipopolysaccharide biosynthesis protein [Caulobacter sp.]|uniref:lipopolysaccharide biosynthesis protein n=1 Tax=Caulobacter sp. TaxID=78 RepID=UPI003BAD0C01
MNQVQDLPSGRLARAAARLGPLLLLFGGTFGSAGFAFATQLLLARALSVADYGHLATVLAAVNLLSPIATFGVNWFWVQAFGAEGRGGYRWVWPSVKLLAVTNLASLVGLAVYFLFFAQIGMDRPWGVVPLCALMLLGQCGVEIISVKHQLEERFGRLAIWQSVSQVGRFLIAALLMLAHALTLDAVLLGYAAIGLLLLAQTLLVVWQFVHGHVRLAGHVAPTEGAADVKRRPPSMLETGRRAFPFALITIFYIVYFQSVILIISAVLGPEQTAMFNSALLIIAAIHLVPNIIFTKFLMGRICRWAEHDAAAFRGVLHLSVATMAIIGLVGMVCTALGARYAMPLIFGPKYAAAATVLAWLSLTIPLRFVQSAYSAVLVQGQNVHRRVTYAGISAVASVAINIVLLPVWGLPGAVIAAIASEFILLALNAWGVGRHVAGIKLSHTFSITELRQCVTEVVRAEWSKT